jgi:hypothetical protein
MYMIFNCSTIKKRPYIAQIIHRLQSISATVSIEAKVLDITASPFTGWVISSGAYVLKFALLALAQIGHPSSIFGQPFLQAHPRVVHCKTACNMWPAHVQPSATNEGGGPVRCYGSDSKDEADFSSTSKDTGYCSEGEEACAFRAAPESEEDAMDALGWYSATSLLNSCDSRLTKFEPIVEVDDGCPDEEELREGPSTSCPEERLTCNEVCREEGETRGEGFLLRGEPSVDVSEDEE